MNTKNIKRKILKDRKFPNSEQIHQRQDFSRINKDYMLIKKIIMKKLMLWGGTIIATSVVGVTVYLNKPDDAQQINKMEQAKQTEIVEQFVQSPLPGKEKQFSVYRLSSKNGGMIYYETGSSIVIPPNAFSTISGKPVSDSIEIKYREFHDAADIFLSGIPMEYDSAGTKYTLESAGMIEILAFDNGDKLNLKKTSPIEVTMASSTNENRFNLYQLDTINKNWVYKGRDKVMLPREQELPLLEKMKNESTPAIKNMIKPSLSNSQKYCFKISYDQHAFPELAAYENVLFEVSDNNFKPAYYKINWDKISLYSSDGNGTYSVRLKKADTTISVNAKPVFDQENYSKAQVAFEEKYKQAIKERDEKETKEKARLSKVNSDLSAYNRTTMVNTAMNMASQNYPSIRSFRTFSIYGMGIHNCDFPIPPIMQFAYSMQSAGEDMKQLSYSTIYVVEKGKNTVFRFSKNDPIRYNRKAEKLIWTVTDDKKEFAFFHTSDVTKLSKGQSNTIVPIIEKNQELALNKIKKFLEKSE